MNKPAAVVLMSLGLVLGLADSGCKGRPRAGPVVGSGSSKSSLFAAATAKLVEIDLSHGAPESTEAGGFFPIPAARTFIGLVRTLEKAKSDQDIKGLYVRLGDHSLGWGRSEEVARLLAEVRQKGKPVVCHAHGLDNSSTWVVLAGCDRIWLSPAGEVSAVGIAGQVVYLKGALDKLKITADILHMGKFKSAGEPLTREGPSDEARQSLTETLASIRAAWLDGVGAARKNPKHRDDAEHGPWGAREAKEHALIDEIGYESEALDDAKKRSNTERVTAGFGTSSSESDSADIGDLIRILTGADEQAGGRPHVSVIVAEGSISMVGGGLLDGGGITAKALSKTLKRVAKDDAVKAVVLRIDSPGGSALASDLLWHEIRELKKKKPVIASVGGMAASGGYYLACAADKILAERTSIVGSIGVLGGKIVLNSAVEQYGINTVTFPASPEPGAAARAAYLSAMTPWDDATRERVRKQMEEIYILFLERVSEGRKMPVDKVKEIAEGRIWSGQQGSERGLVDELGGLVRAIQIARDLGKLDDRAPVQVEGQADSFFDALLGGGGGEHADSGSVVELAAERAERRAKTTLLTTVPSGLRPFVASFAPLLDEETTLAALPFALIVR